MFKQYNTADLNGYDIWFNKVVKMCEHRKFNIDPDILFTYDLPQIYKSGATARQTVEGIAKELDEDG